MKLIKQILRAAALILFLASCGKTNNAVKMIPGDAFMVVHFNAKSLLSKLSWEEVKKTSWFTELYNDTGTTAFTKKLMDDPAASGIDLDAALFFFIQKGTGNKAQLVFEGNIKDAAAFEAFNKTLNENSAVSRDGDVALLALENEAVVGWNKEKFAYVLNTPDLPAKANYPLDSINLNTKLTSPAQDLSQACKRLFALKTDSSMAKNEKFSDLLQEEGDIHSWQNNEEMVKSSGVMGMLGMIKLDVFLKGNITTATAGFNNGKIDIKQKFYVSPELTDVLKRNGGGKVNTDMIKSIPSQNINGLLAIHFKPEGLREIIKLTGMDGLINQFLSQQGFTLEDFVKANNGDVIFAVTDFSLSKGLAPLEGKALQDTAFFSIKPGANYLFSIGVGDKPSFDKLMAAGKKIGGDLPPQAGIYFANNDKVFAIGNSQQFVTKYLSAGKSNFDFVDKIAGNPVALFVDLQKILLSASSQALKDSSYKAVMDESVKIWQNVYSTGGEYKDDAFVMNSEINFMNKSANSLRQLNGYFDRISKVMIKKIRENVPDTLYPPLSNLDSTALQP